ncbi:MAG: hypothetical protein MRZ98_01165 [Clostridiales bacterium]|nr:hypothetical protein [Clostridiales bacterium]
MPEAETPPQTGDSFPVAALWSLCVLALLSAAAGLLRPGKRKNSETEGEKPLPFLFNGMIFVYTDRNQ